MIGRVARRDSPPGPGLCPSQEGTLSNLKRAILASELVLLDGEKGGGRTTILRAMQAECGGRIIDMTDLMEVTRSRSARRFEQSLYELVLEAFAEHDIVYFDNITRLKWADRAGGYTRYGLISGVLHGIREFARTAGKRLVAVQDRLAAKDRAYELAQGASWDDKGVVVRVRALDMADYRHILINHLGRDRLANLEIEDLAASAGRLTPAMLTLLARLVENRGLPSPSARDLQDLIDREILHSNVDLTEVEAVTLDGLVGVDAVVRRLDRAVLLPLRDPDLARDLRLEPKHGVLIYGPPGTGKTTIGRALAHQMRGKFFLIDGDIVHDGPLFYEKVDAVFEAARRSSPSVVFIDDADVILGDPEMQHFGRYLLTKLDGLQSQSMARVCVMMTAMNIATMPPAMIRSGRLEVWLEMVVPDRETRGDLIQSYAERLPLDEAGPAAAAKRDDLIQLSEGFTPADLRRVVSDAAGRLAFDRQKERQTAAFGDYLLVAAEDVGRQKALAERAINARGDRRYY